MDAWVFLYIWNIVFLFRFSLIWMDSHMDYGCLLTLDHTSGYLECSTAVSLGTCLQVGLPACCHRSPLPGGTGGYHGTDRLPGWAVAPFSAVRWVPYTCLGLMPDYSYEQTDRLWVPAILRLLEIWVPGFLEPAICVLLCLPLPAAPACLYTWIPGCWVTTPHIWSI